MAGRGQQLAAVLGLVSVLGVGAWLRCYRIDRPVFTPDEAFTWRVASCSLVDMLCRAAGDTHPPGHFVAQKIWMAIFGDGVIAVRMLSVCCGLASAMLVYALVVEAIRGGERATPAVRFGAAVSALLAAVYLGQIGASRTGRMYALGVLLSGISGYLLLRALRARNGRGAWWLSYGAAVAAFCYTHNFALFGVAAQAIYVGLECLRRRVPRRRRQQERQQAVQTRHPNARPAEAQMQGLRPAMGFLMACTVALSLYAPWVPVFLKQAARVKESFWIPQISWMSVQELLVKWFFGLNGSGVGPPSVWFTVLLLLSVYVIWNLDRAGLLFLLQALVPWGLAFAVSIWGSRPLLLLRYLLFAQYALIALLGITCARLRGRLETLAFAMLVVLPCGYASCKFILEIPDRPPVLAQAVEYVRAHHHPQDLIVVDRPEAVNCVGFYAKHGGLDDVNIRWLLWSYSITSHINHIASLTTDDVLDWQENVPPPSLKRYWVLLDGGSYYADVAVHEGWKVKLRRDITYGRRNAKVFSVILLDSTGQVPPH